MEDTSPRDYKAYIVLTETEALAVEDKKTISTSDFEWAPHYNFLKLSAGPEFALNIALEARTKQSLQTPYNATTWFLLTLCPSREQWLRLFMAKQPPSIQKGPDNKGWRVQGELDFKDNSPHWCTLKIGPIGIDGWTARALRFCIPKTDVQCSECTAGGINVWKPKS